MRLIDIMALQGMHMPSGRATRVLIGENGALAGQHFCQGYVVIKPGGSIPLHHHQMEETYTVLTGCGKITVNEQEAQIHAGQLAHILPGETHSVVNDGKEDLHLMFVYSPYLVADHWAEELAGHDTKPDLSSSNT